MDKESRNIMIECSTEMTNEEYRTELQKIFDGVEDNRMLRYFYIFVSEKIKLVL